MKPARAPADNSRGADFSGFPLAELRRLIRLVQRTGIGELELSAGGRTVRISQTAQGGVTMQPPAIRGLQDQGPETSSTASPAKPAEEKSSRLLAITSPMVGTFYRAPAPDADPYVSIGDIVEVGQTVCIVEAMKLMNEIESEVRGRVAQLPVENAQPVEFGQKLFLLEPI